MRWNDHLLSNDEVFAAGTSKTDHIPRLVIDDDLFCWQRTNDRTWLITGKKTADAQPWRMITTRPEAEPA